MEFLARTSDIALRRLMASDLVPFQDYRNDPEVARYQGWSPMRDDDALGFLRAMETEPILSPGAWIQIGISRPSDNQLMGDMGWFLSKDGNEAELGITLATAHQRKGLATHAMRCAVLEVFARCAARRIVAYADIRNIPSCMLMPRAGFTHIGIEVTDGVTEHVFEHRRPV